MHKNTILSSSILTSYFDDLQIRSVNARTFANMKHRTVSCQPDYFSLEFISSGKLKLHLDKTLITLNAPVFFWIGDHHKTFRYEFCTDCDSYTHYWVDYSGERGRRIYEWLCRCSEHYCLPADPAQTENIVNIYKTMFERFHNDAKYYHPDLAVSLESLLAILVRQQIPVSHRESDPYNLDGVAEMFSNNPFDRFSIEQLASARGLSLMHFRALFRAKFGQPVNDYILSNRMKQAADLLLSGKLRISEISEHCGFSELSSFSRMFKRFYGLSPRKYLAERQRIIRQSLQQK